MKLLDLTSLWHVKISDATVSKRTNRIVPILVGEKAPFQLLNNYSKVIIYKYIIKTIISYSDGTWTDTIIINERNGIRKLNKI